MENPNSVIVKVLRGREYGEIMKNGWKLHKLVKDINLKFKKLTSPKQVIPMKSMPGFHNHNQTTEKYKETACKKIQKTMNYL